MNQRMPARHFWRLQHNCVSTGSSYGTTAFDRMASAIGCFQPGTFLWGHAHTEALSKVTADGKYLPSNPDLGIARGDPALGLSLSPYRGNTFVLRAQNRLSSRNLAGWSSTDGTSRTPLSNRCPWKTGEI